MDGVALAGHDGVRLAAAIRGLSVAKRLLTRARTQYNVVPAR